MRQLQVTAPAKQKDAVEEILEEYSSDVSSSKGEKNDKKVAEFTATVESDEIHDLTTELKGIKEIDHGELSIRVLQQESLIQKGQETKGSTSTLSQEEIYSKAQQFAGFTKPQWGLIGLSSAIAAYGLILNNVIVVVGAMMLAPMLSPFVSGAISIAVGDKSLMVESLRAGFESIVIAILVSFIAVLPMTVGSSATLELVVSPGLPSLLLSFLVGSAAALTFATGLRDQIAGVAVAIALVPPLASVGIGLKMGDFYLAFQAASVAFINVLAVLISGFMCFRLLGLKPSTYYKQKEAEQIRRVVPIALVILALIAMPVSYLSYQNYESYTLKKSVETTAQDFFGDSMVSMEFHDSTAKIIVVGDHNETAFRERLPEGFSANVIELQRVDSSG